MRFKLISHDDQVTRVECEGEITQYQFTPDKDPLAELVGAGIYQRCVLLSLENTTYIDSSGIGWLLHCHKQFTREGGRLVLHSVSPAVLQVLKLMQLKTILAIAADETEALQLAQRAKA